MGLKIFIKKFGDWISIKSKIDTLEKRPFFREREVWNCSWGCNVGFEIDGKNNNFLRPVLVFKKLSHNTFLAIPLTTKLKNGSWYAKSFVQKKEGRYIFAQIRIIDSKRLLNKLEQIPEKEFFSIQEKFLCFMKS